MVACIWCGWTAPEKTDACETLLRADIFPGILAKGVVGFECS